MNPATQTRQSNHASGMYWFLGYAIDSRYNHVMPPNSNSCEYSGVWDNRGAYIASSRHPGVVNVLFGDGTVHGVKSTITIQSWWALGTQAGGEVVSSTDY